MTGSPRGKTTAASTDGSFAPHAKAEADPAVLDASPAGDEQATVAWLLMPDGSMERVVHVEGCLWPGTKHITLADGSTRHVHRDALIDPDGQMWGSTDSAGGSGR